MIKAPVAPIVLRNRDDVENFVQPIVRQGDRITNRITLFRIRVELERFQTR